MSDEDSAPIAPLRGMNGVVPPAPRWFEANVAAPYESFVVEVEGATIDCRAWGERGKPGLVFLHGNAAHLGWWSFLTPFFADDYRVVVLSFSGMGRSDRRPHYSMDQYTAEAWAAAEAGGACLAGPPVLIGHSAGGIPVMGSAARLSNRMRAGVIVDTGLPGPEMIKVSTRPSYRTYADLPAALDRFRLSPNQPCENIYIADYIARMGLKQVEDGSWTWRFDRTIWGGMDLGDPWADLAEAKARLAIIRGACSELTAGPMNERFVHTAPAGTPFIEIPDAYHHVMVDQPLALVSALRALLAAWP